MSLDINLKCTHCNHSVWYANITHNLNAMADEAGIYEAVWRPEECGITTAGQLIEPLRKAIAEMKAEPERFKKHNPENGWGSYDVFVPWLERCLESCIGNPDCRVEACR